MSKTRRQNPAQPVKDVLAAVLGELKKRRDTPLVKIINNWENIVPANIAKHARPGALKNKVLYINVDSPAWLYELTLEHKDMFLAQAQKLAGKEIVQEVRFRVGKV